MQLPFSKDLEIKYLSRLFDNTSECYKFFWFQALVTKVLDRRTTITYDELVNEMIADAWYMVTEYHLNLGPKDTLENLIHYIQGISNMKSSETKESIIKYLSTCNDKQVKDKKRILTKNVPYRMQAPFMRMENGSVWASSEAEMIRLINQEKELMYYFGTLNGMYTEIKVQPEWQAYIVENQEIIKGWLNYSMIMYLQRRNPSVPGIAEKLLPPKERKLEKVKKYWSIVAEITPLQEIYGKNQVAVKEMSIDHFIPWSYVAHDELWNLHPTTRSINSSKSNYLPDWNMYFSELAAIEYEAYKLIWEHDKVHTEFEKCAREHLNNLDVKQRIYRRGQSFTDFKNALGEVIEPVYLSAKNCGFREWTYGE